MDQNDDNDPLLGRVIDGRFTIQSVLGRGGMGVVFRAHQASLERSVALKVMTGVPPERESEFQRRFFLEAATAAKLKHPNTITVFDYGSSVVDGDRVFFIAMELLDGVPLQKLVTKGRALPPLRAVHIALQICRSLREAHRAGVVHRDLKPGNVMLVKQDDVDEMDGDFVKVLDFGLAKVGGRVDPMKPIEGLTKAGTFMGSPRYVAPEQVEGRVVDARADIYSLGCILYRMLTGRVPFDGKTPVEIMLKHIHDAAPPLAVPGLPASVQKLVSELLAKDAKDRPQSMDVVMHRLKLIRAELGGTGSGIMVVSDDRFSNPSHPPVTSRADELAVSEPPFPVVDPIPMPTRVDRVPSLSGSAPSVRSLPSRPSAPSTPSAPSAEGPREKPRTDPGPTETDWRAAIVSDESTRPTYVVGKLRRPPQTPWAGITAGVLVGLLLCGTGVAWRLGLIDRGLASLDAARAPRDPSPPPSTVKGPLGPLAASARIRIRTDPPGADVLEVGDGLPVLLGITPLEMAWDIAPDAKPRELLLRKEGYKPSAATIAPPAKGPTEPIWLDVEAALKPR